MRGERLLENVHAHAHSSRGCLRRAIIRARLKLNCGRVRILASHLPRPHDYSSLDIRGPRAALAKWFEMTNAGRERAQLGRMLGSSIMYM